ncbi:MAG: polyketide synthase dehydratase domain-containing protein [Pseudonocardiales bacterium]|nr:polyketide synthase dehydratase domain-containing protein [Pseudonocardiales bacterium]MBV9032311.1 polyketide synthase dehydratase domain-containing protein [Pseudonocardiales bacterium]
MAEPVEVAIVGMAAVFPGAPDLATYWSNILAGVDAITTVPATRWDASYYDPEAAATRRGDRLYCRRGGFVEHATFDPARFGIMPLAVSATEPDQLIALQVAAAALADAGGENRLGDRSRAGVIVGRGGYLTPGLARLDQRTRTANQLVTTLRELLPDLADTELDRVRTAFQAQLGPEQPETAIDLVPNLVASRVAKRLDLAGPAYTVDAACASSLVAIDHAVAELTTGRCDVMLAGGVHHCHDITLWSVFSQLGALSPSQRIRPFHRGADGILIGEGTGMVVLKRLADAADDRVYAVIRGTGVASDGRATSLMSPHAEGQVRAIERAWRAAALDPTEAGALGLLEAHGTATPAGDATELASLARVFGAPDGAGRDIGIGSVKSMIGHAMPAAGVAGLIKAALAVHHGVLPPTLHCDDPHPALVGSRFAPVTEARPWLSLGHAPRRAGVDAFGFGGINAHTILEQPPGTRRSPRPRPSGPERVLLLAGRTPAELARQLEVPDAGLLDRDDVGAPPAGGPCRLAIVAPTARRLTLARRILEQGTPWRGREDIWFTAAPLRSASTPGQLAFVFPGLEQGFEPRVDDVADHFGLARPQLGDSTVLGRHGLGVFTVGRLLDAALRELDVIPDLVAGHSVGEWNAMTSACIHPRSAVEELIASFDPATLQVPGLLFAALGCGADQAAEAIGAVVGVVVSHDNCPHQSIICGAEAAVVAVLDRLRARGVTGQVLPFRSGFHSPMLEPYLRRILDTFANLPVRPPTIPIWSSTTVERYPDQPETIHSLIARHLLEPVRFGPLIRRLHEAGVRAFIQVGTGSLPGFVADTLAGLPHLAVTANTSRRCGLDQLRRVAAALWVEGWEPRFDRLPCSSRMGATRVRSASSGPAVALDLGAPLVRLGTTVAALAPAQRVPALPAKLPAAGHSVLTEFDAALRDATIAAADVVGSWARTTPRQAGTTRDLSLATMPYLADHCFYRQPDGWPEPADRYPVVPLTTVLELMADAARALSPGRAVVGISDVRALCWLAVAPPVTVTTRTTLHPDGNVTVVLDGYARGTVLLADDYPTYHPTLSAPSPPLTGSRSCDVTARGLYQDRWMFHGPAFQGVTELGPVTDDGIVGELIVPPAPGALLDTAGQLLGFWVMVRAARNRLAFPAGIDRVHYHGSPPGPGERVRCVVRIGSVSATEVVADLELRRADGRLWARIQRWRDRRFDTDEVTWPVFLFPERNRIAQRQPGGWYLVRDRWPDPATRELVMRRYLSAAERADYQRRTPRAARQWLLGRIAVKDAVRQWLWDAGAGPVFPIEVTVSNDASGRPRVAGPFDETPEVSLAHTGSLAAALVGPHGVAAGVGIDIERIVDRDDRTVAAILTDAERGLLDGLCPSGPSRPGWVTRFWAAKEAVAKAAGTGLGGRPHEFAVQRVEGDRLLVTAGEGASSSWTQTEVGTEPEPYAVAWTSPAASGLALEHRDSHRRGQPDDT